MQLPEPPVVVTGTVFRTRPKTKFGSPGEVEGFLVSLLDGDGGVEVKLTPAQYAQLSPQIGQTVAYRVQYFPWQMEGGRAGLSCSLIAPLTVADLDQLHAAISEPAASK